MKRLDEIERLYHLAADLPPPERAAFLQRECTGDPGLRRKVEDLLQHRERVGEFLETPAIEWITGEGEPGMRGAGGAPQESSLQSESSKLGRQLGRYRILRRLGKGGMGEVFLAEDISLERKVAIKFLPQSLREDEVALKRFLREAKTAAALDHPYICHVNEVAQTEEGEDYLVMEYVEGLTLEQRMAEGPLSLNEALRIAGEVAEALAKAHAEGVIHRDLKPANIMLTTEGHPKVMDFGLAKRLAPEDAEALTSTGLTTSGTVMGTLAYMSPEQLRGHELDRRADIFSFGIVLYEALSQVNPFRRSTAIHTANAILYEEPLQLSGKTPETLRRAVQKMLAKAPEDRFQLISEFQSELERVRKDLEFTDEDFRKRLLALGRKVWRWASLPAAVLLGVVGTLLLQGPTRDDLRLPSLRYEIPLPESRRLGHWFRHGLEVSPDGEVLAYVMGDLNPNSMPLDPLDRAQIYLRSMNRWQARPLGAGDLTFQPFFSPDSRWLGFVQYDAPTEKFFLKKVEVSGGEPVTLCEVGLPFGASWGDGQIVFAEEMGGLLRVSESGGNSERLTYLDVEAGEGSHRLPRFLPGGKGVLYTSPRFRWEQSQIFVYSLETGERKLLLEGGTDARYLASGHLVFAREGRLMAVGFNLEALEVIGAPVPVLEEVNHPIYAGGTPQEVGAAQFSVSQDGLLAYAPGSVFPEIPDQVVWVDREGRETQTGVDVRHYARLRLSKSGKRILLTHWYPPGGVWLYEVDRQLMRRQTFDGMISTAIWGPEPDWMSIGAGSDGVLVKKIDSGPGSQEWRGSNRSNVPITLGEWTRDGRWLALLAVSNQWDIWILSPQQSAQAFLDSPFNEEYPAFSPDGDWLAYSSDESGRKEVYVRPFPGPGDSIQVSTEGGYAPVWSADGAELVYRWQDGFFSVSIDPRNERLSVGRASRLFSGEYNDAFPVRAYDLAPDGRLLLTKKPSRETRLALAKEVNPGRIRVVQNWFEEVELQVQGGN